MNECSMITGVQKIVKRESSHERFESCGSADEKHSTSTVTEINWCSFESIGVIS